MHALWGASEQLSVQSIVDSLGAGHNYKTAMTVLNRLVAKGLLERELDGRAYRYRPTQSREEFLRSTANMLVHDYIEAYGAESGSHLAQAIEAATSRTGAKPAGTLGPETSEATPQGYVDDEPEPLSNMWRVVGIAAVLQIITLILKRRR